MTTQLQHNYQDFSTEYEVLFDSDKKQISNLFKLNSRINGQQDNSAEQLNPNELSSKNYTTIYNPKEEYNNIIQLSPKIIPKEQDPFISLQKWEGTVIEINKEFFTARLVNLTCKAPDEEAEIGIEEISHEDVNLLKPGAIFYWNIGYNDKPSGRLRVSLIRFRRLPVWSEKEIITAKTKAKIIQNALDWK